MKGSGITEWIGMIAWAISPILVAAFCVLIYAIPLQFGNFNIPMPLFPFMAIYFWSMTRPELMPPILVFFIGLFQDMLSGGAVGLWALTYLLGTAIISTQRDVIVGNGRTAMWAGFALASILTTCLVWGFARIALGPDASGGQLGLEIIVTVLAYPLAGRGFAFVQRVTNQARRLTVHSTMASF